MLTGFARIEASMAAAYAERPDGWPVGPEKMSGAGWYTPVRSVQIVEVKARAGQSRFLVYSFFPFRRIDLRYPVLRYRSLSAARRAALLRMSHASGFAELHEGRRHSIELWRAGGIYGFEVLR